MNISSIPYTLLFTIAGYVFIGSFIGTLIMFLIFIDVNSDELPVYLGFAFHTSIELLFLGFAQKDIQWYRNTSSTRDSETIIEDAKTLAIIIGMAGLVNFLGMFDTIGNIRQNIFSLAVSIVYAGYIGIILGMSSSLLFRLMYQRPHFLLTKLTLWIIGLSILMLILQFFLHEQLRIGIHILAAIIGIIGFYNTKGIQWYSGINKKQKTDLAWSSIVIVISLAIIAGNYERVTFIALNQILILVEPFMISLGIWLFLIAIRLSILAINSLPTAGLIDKKSLEFSALAELTTIASTTQNYQQIIENAITLIEKALILKGIYCKVSIQDEMFEEYRGELGTELSILNRNKEFINWKKTQIQIGNLFEIPDSMDSDKILKIKSIISLFIQIDQSKSAEFLLAHDLPYHFTPEDESILRTLTESFRIALRNASLLQLEIEHQKFEQEIEIARGVQNALLPQRIPMPNEFEIATYSMPARIVGGDFYDVFEMKNGNTCVIIADVSGKGIPAAFWMATIRGVLLSLQYGSYGPKEILMHLQQSLIQIMDAQVFITASCLIIEKESGSMTYARAGHMPLLIRRNHVIEECIPRGLGIGLSKNLEVFDKNLEEIHIYLEKDEMLILFTDGLSEMNLSMDSSHNHTDQYSSFIRFLEEIGSNPSILIASIDAEIKIRHKHMLVDDITVIAIKRNSMNE